MVLRNIPREAFHPHGGEEEPEAQTGQGTLPKSQHEELAEEGLHQPSLRPGLALSQLNTVTSAGNLLLE